MDRTPVLLACLLVLAGCTAPSTPSPTAGESALATRTPTGSSDALPVNESRVYDRVAGLLDSDVPQPSVRTVAAADAGSNYYGRQLEAFHRLLLDADGIGNLTPAAYYDPEAHRVTVLLYDGVPGDATNESELRALLAHEYAHAVTYRDEQYADSMRRAGGGGTTDAARVRQAMVEGAATYVSDEYSERYLEGFDDSRRMAREYRRDDALGRYLTGAYRFGGRYFDRRLTSPANLTQVFRSPPETTEQLIHDYAPGEEPPADLSVTVSTGENASVGGRDTTGELFVRDVLGGPLSESRAGDAAAGWGNDRVIDVWNYDANESEQRNYVWALRWDGERDADEFAAAFADYAENRGERIGEGRWRVGGERVRLDRVSDDTVVAVIGGPDTVERIRTSGADGNVSVNVAPA